MSVMSWTLKRFHCYRLLPLITDKYESISTNYKLCNLNVHGVIESNDNPLAVTTTIE